LLETLSLFQYLFSLGNGTVGTVQAGGTVQAVRVVGVVGG